MVEMGGSVILNGDWITLGVLVATLAVVISAVTRQRISFPALWMVVVSALIVGGLLVVCVLDGG